MTLTRILQAARQALEALGSLIPRPEFTHLDAGFEHFTKKGTALPEETLEWVAFISKTPASLTFAT